ncbi:ABC transporter substrate-binding protein [Daejeonella sp.]|uniref:ABC transporter substrate-binding protein n=1 Tax=Daejeonella sp. TaxID=2805397 RepID=UPI0030C3FAAE
MTLIKQVKIKLRRFLIIAGISCYCLVGSAPVNAQETNTIRLQLKWHHQFQFAGYYAAEKKGFFKEAGFNVDLLEGNTENPPVQNVLNGTAEFGVTGADIINHHIAKKPVVVISAIFQHSPYVFLTLADSKINTATDLAGKRIMASEDQGWPLLKALFIREGIPMNKIKIVAHNWNHQDLISGKVDAITAYSTVEPNQIRKLGYNVTLIRPIDYGIDFYGDVLFTTRSIANDEPEKVEKFNAACLKGWVYAMSHPSEMADYILTLPGVKQRGVSKEDLLNEAEEMQKLILPDLVEMGHMNPGRWQSMLDVYKQIGIAQKTDSINGFLFADASVRKVLYFDVLLYVLGIAASLFVIALIWNWQLRKIVHKKTTALQKEITFRKGTEQRLELAIQAAGLGIWEWDLVSNKTSYDSNWVRALGYDPDEFLKNSSWLDIVHEEDHDTVREIITGQVDGRYTSNSLAYRIKTKQGPWKWILSFSKVVSFQEDGKAANMIGTHLDIDFIKEKEIELQEITNELRKTNSELEKFAYITSHNLRAPVVNLMSLTEMQSEEALSPELNEEITHKIHYCVKQLDSTLSDLIEIVASKSGNHVHRESLDIETELNLIIRSIEKQVTESGAQIEINFSEINTIYFPKRFLHSILLNLLTNAVKYGSDKRKLIISLKTRVQKDYTVLYFSDNGLGMDMTKFGSKIFGLYQRFHNKIEGKGLGLYIIKSQIESLDGKIEVDSMPDVGTTFKISFKNGVIS